jgi:hypothetical protein
VASSANSTTIGQYTAASSRARLARNDPPVHRQDHEHDYEGQREQKRDIFSPCFERHRFA